jgi:phage terminase large subunit
VSEVTQDAENIVMPYGYRPRSYQMPVWQYFMNGGKRAVCVWHRRAGKDLLAINLIATLSCQRPGLYWHLFPTYNQGRKIAWDGMTRDGKKFRDAFPKSLVDGIPNNTEMKVSLRTGSMYQVVGTDDPDRLVGANPVGIVLSEYSLQDPRAWNIIRPILAENGGWALFIYTARGHNHGWDLLQMARNNPKWFSEVLTAGDSGTKDDSGLPVISNETIDEERASGMPEELIQQEFFCSFEAPVVGAYYGAQMMKALKEGRIGYIPPDPRLPVYTAWDLGVADSCAIWLYQQFGMEIRLVDYYEQSGEGLAHYARILSEKSREGGYLYGRHFFPWDIDVKELSSGQARIDTIRKLGLRPYTIVPQHEVMDGIDHVRSILHRCFFDQTKCELGIESLRQYRKEWDEKRKIYHDKPLHDWTSHGADAFRTLAWGFRESRRQKRPQKQQVHEYDPLAY